jgi:hypothetical protein
MLSLKLTIMPHYIAKETDTQEGNPIAPIQLEIMIKAGMQSSYFFSNTGSLHHDFEIQIDV